MSTAIDTALTRAARDALAPLWTELARRYAESEASPVRIHLQHVEEESRRAIADLFGWDRLPSAERCQVDIAELADVLGLPDGATSLRALVERITGPIPNRAAERRAVREQRAALWAWLDERIATRPELAPWAARLRSNGVPYGGAERFRDVIELALRVLDELPAGGVPLTMFAQRTSGDPHALDHDRRLAVIVLDAVAAIRHRPVPVRAEDVRRLWSDVGVVVDQLSASVLTLGLRPAGGTPLATTLSALSDCSEAYSVTHAQLERWPISVPSGTAVYAFENPVVLATAGGWSGAPLVCTSGWPNIAVVTLLRQLSACGAIVRYHGDLDPKGLEIAAHLHRRLGVVPWRMTAADYTASAAESAAPITGRIPPTPWDPALAEAIDRTGRAVYEEQVAAQLIDEIAERS